MLAPWLSGGLAVGSRWRRHQDCAVAANVAARDDGTAGAQGTQGRSGRRAAAGRRCLGRPRPGVHDSDREEIARLAGHDRTTTTEVVYRHELRPVIATGAEIMDRVLG